MTYISKNELVADAFAGLSVQEQSILILHFVLDLPDQEVGRLVECLAAPFSGEGQNH